MQTEIILFFTKLLTPVGNFRSLKIVILRSTSLKLGLLIRKLYVDFKNPITNESVDPFSPFFLDTPYIYIYLFIFIYLPSINVLNVEGLKSLGRRKKERRFSESILHKYPVFSDTEKHPRV